MRLLILAILLSQSAVYAAELKTRLEKLVNSSSLAKSGLGLIVIDTSGTKPSTVYALNEEQDFTPASVTKLATASAVLDKLGPSFKLQTTLQSAAKIQDGVLKGDLILRGGGDAGFVSETMWFLVNEFVRTGIHTVEGDVIVDDSFFDSIRTDPSRDPERVDRAYDAPVGAMSFNWNSINIFVRPTSPGKPPQVYLDPLTDYFKVVNEAQTSAGSGSSIEVSRNGGKIVVQGKIGVNHDEVVAYKNVDDPVDWSGRNLIFFLKQRGITVTGQVKAGKKPAGAQVLAKADSKPVSQHVSDMMKFSNNYVAEMLTKDLASGQDKAATLDDGMKLIRSHLNSIGIDSKRFVLLNPSGLSRKNKMKVRDLAEILLHAQKEFPTFAEFLFGFPLSGQDGTLKRRMTSLPGWVRGKTGSLTGIVSLAGFAGRKEGGTRAFVFVFNGNAKHGEAARHLFDQLAMELVQ